MTFDLVVIKVLPGTGMSARDDAEMGCVDDDDHDSHMSPHDLEWYLPLAGELTRRSCSPSRRCRWSARARRMTSDGGRVCVMRPRSRHV